MVILTGSCVGGRALLAIFGAAEFRSGSEFAAQNAEADGREFCHRHGRMFFLPRGMFRPQNRLSLTQSLLLEFRNSSNLLKLPNKCVQNYFCLVSV